MTKLKPQLAIGLVLLGSFIGNGNPSLANTGKGILAILGSEAGLRILNLPVAQEWSAALLGRPINEILGLSPREQAKALNSRLQRNDIETSRLRAEVEKSFLKIQSKKFDPRFDQEFELTVTEEFSKLKVSRSYTNALLTSARVAGNSRKYTVNLARSISARVAKGELPGNQVQRFLEISERLSRRFKQSIFGMTATECASRYQPAAVKNLMKLSQKLQEKRKRDFS